MKKETVALYTELLSRHFLEGMRSTIYLLIWHLPEGTE
jgi:hypothetical protein